MTVSDSAAAPKPKPPGHLRHVCDVAKGSHVRCNAAQAADQNGKVIAASNVAGVGGLGPSDLWSAYTLPAQTTGAGQIIAIVDAMDDPNAESDLAAYRQTFGLAPCTTGNGCFGKFDQNGGHSYPAADSGWAMEIATDLEVASAVCPQCKIMLVEAASSSYVDIMTAVDRAVAQGATEVSLSLGGAENSSITQLDQHLNHPGVAVAAATGDNGYGVEYPASSPFVTAVGGTSLSRTGGGRGWSEVAWSGAGSGCSTVEAKPVWQHDGSCGNRTGADVSAVADPSTGVAVYDTYGTSSPWLLMGGTSVATPIVAGAFALHGGAGANTGGSAWYNGTFHANDVTTGNNGSCGWLYLCTSYAGYDGPTGVGTPNLAPFSAAYAVDIYGRLHAGSSPAVANAYIPGGAQARGVAMAPGHVGGYVVDSFGYVRQFGGAPQVYTADAWPGRDLARGIALRSNGVSGYVLDCFGNLHPFGGAPRLALTDSWKPDIARGLVMTSDSSGYILDAFGGMHPFGSAPYLPLSDYWYGLDLARGILMNPDAKSGWIVDAYGGLHPFGGAPYLPLSDYWYGRFIIRGGTLIPGTKQGYLIDYYGGFHPFGGSPYLSFAANYQSGDIMRGIAAN